MPKSSPFSHRPSNGIIRVAPLRRNQRAISDVLLGVWDAALLQALAGGAANNHDEQVGDGEGGAVATSGLGQWRRRSPHVGTRCVVLHNVKRKNPEYARTAEAHR